MIDKTIAKYHQISHSTDTAANDMLNTSQNLTSLASNTHYMIRQFEEAISKN